MFWSTNTTDEISSQASRDSGGTAAPREERGPLSEYLREQLRERLMVAIDFATLGAYELTAPEGDAALVEPADRRSAPGRDAAVAEAHAPAPSVHRGPGAPERPQRVSLFAKVAADCPHRTELGGPPCDPRRDTALRHRRPVRGRRRGGMTAAAEQPCTWQAPAGD
jgi:hypothetical protein